MRSTNATRLLSFANLLCWICLAMPWLASPARAEPTLAVLVYERGPELPGCPSKASLARAVAARLGYDPFRDEHGVRVEARILARSDGLVALVEARSEAGGDMGRRELSSKPSDCVELARALALAISVAIDPFVLTRSASVQTEETKDDAEPPVPAEGEPEVGAPQPTAVAHEPPAAVDPKPPDPMPARRLALLFDLLVSVGLVPAPRPAFGTSLWWRGGGLWSLGGELRYDLPAQADGPRGGVVRAQLASARASLCLGPERFAGCVGSAQGLVVAAGREVDAARRELAWYPAAHVHAQLQLMRRAGFLMLLRAGMDVPWRRTALEINQTSAWTSPRLSAWGGLSIGYRVP